MPDLLVDYAKEGAQLLERLSELASSLVASGDTQLAYALGQPDDYDRIRLECLTRLDEKAAARAGRPPTASLRFTRDAEHREREQEARLDRERRWSADHAFEPTVPPGA